MCQLLSSASKVVVVVVVGGGSSSSSSHLSSRQQATITRQVNKPVVKPLPSSEPQPCGNWLRTTHERKKVEEERASKGTTLQKKASDFTAAQVQEARIKVSSFVPWRSSGKAMSMFA